MPGVFVVGVQWFLMLGDHLFSWSGLKVGAAGVGFCLGWVLWLGISIYRCLNIV